jgi:hypothetical protein
MQDDREVYLDEIIAQADNLYEYFISFIGASEARYPWTIEFIGCGLSIGNLAYLHYKDMFKRVRPSVLCPGLIPPFGPPAHPAFPSGHSMLGHLIALMLLEIPTLCERYGIADPDDGQPGLRVDPYPTLPVVTITSARPAVVTWPNNRLHKGDPIVFQTDGELPGPIKPGRIYYVFNFLPAGATGGDNFTISAIRGPNATAIDTSGKAQNGKFWIPQNPLYGSAAIRAPMLWLGQRIAKNRERLGVHYASDSNASRHFAGAIWRALFYDKVIECPTLHSVLQHASAEWRKPW